MNCKRMCAFVFAFVMCLSVLVAPEAIHATDHTQVKQVEVGTVKPDTWTAVDGLGRTVSSYSQVGDTREDKFVGMFYWSWHNNWSSYPARNISQIISQYPEAWNDVNHSAWGGKQTINDPFFWNEPVFGYYRNSDKYVLRKHAELLADAGVDVIFFDCSNEFVCQRTEAWGPSENSFSDNFNDEFSRDIEPTKGILKDNFYYQLVDNIRKFKGVSKPEAATADKNVNKTIDINSSQDQWADVALSFDHYTGSTQARNSGCCGRCSGH